MLTAEIRHQPLQLGVLFLQRNPAVRAALLGGCWGLMLRS